MLIMMKEKMTRICLLGLFISAVFVIALSLLPDTVAAATKDDVCRGIGLVSNSNGCAEPSDGSSLKDVVATAVNILSFVVGIAAVIMIILGGFKFVTSGGDSNSTNSARNTIIYALVGLVIAAMAQIIVRFVLNEV